ncbi:neuralized-like protein 4 [Leucoraja erinacea]|nr:neuralized-like protein 4 [Leucoraja erinacea]
MRYVGLDRFCPKIRFKDVRSQRHHQAQVAFQVCVRPGSYKIGPPSAGTGESIDPRFSNNEIEWITKERASTVLYGLLVRVE